MGTFKRFRSLGLAGLFFTICMLAITVAQAQTLVEATILTTNVDVQNKRLYVEMNYTPKACGNYQLRFKLTTATDAVGKYASLDSLVVLTNNTGTPKVGTYKLPSTVEGGATIKVLNLDNTAVGGYSLRFAITGPMISAADAPKVCMETYKLAYRCQRCGVEGGDEVFTKKDVAVGCPYTGDDIVACKQRVGGAKNWEVYVQDPRDCNVYNAVQIGNRWWFAQNLNYQGKGGDLTASKSAATATVNSIFFCPAPTGNASSPDKEYEEYMPQMKDGKWACKIYGALYTWNTARALDGGTPKADDSESTLPTNTSPSAIRGICPPNWFLPNDADWGIVLNRVEGCGSPENINNQRDPLDENCNHFTTTNDTKIAVTANLSISGSVISQLNNMGTAAATLYYYPLGKDAGRFVRSTPMCPDGTNCDVTALDASVNPPVYSARWMKSNSLGTDWFGLRVLPAGYRFSLNDAASGTFYGRGQYAAFMSSTRWSDGDKTPVVRIVSFEKGTIMRAYSTAATSGNNNAYSVRCVR